MKFLIFLALYMYRSLLRVHRKRNKRTNCISHVSSDPILLITRPTVLVFLWRNGVSSKKVTISRTSMVTLMGMERARSFVLVSLLSENMVIDKRSNTSWRTCESFLCCHLSYLPAFTLTRAFFELLRTRIKWLELSGSIFNRFRLFWCWHPLS